MTGSSERVGSPVPDEVTEADVDTDVEGSSEAVGVGFPVTVGASEADVDDSVTGSDVESEMLVGTIVGGIEVGSRILVTGLRIPPPMLVTSETMPPTPEAMPLRIGPGPSGLGVIVGVVVVEVVEVEVSVSESVVVADVDAGVEEGVTDSVESPGGVGLSGRGSFGPSGLSWSSPTNFLIPSPGWSANDEPLSNSAESAGRGTHRGNRQEI